MADTLFSAGTIIASSWLNDADKNVYNILASVVGTNTITATGPQPLTSYTRGTRLWFTPTATNTGPTTLNINPPGGASLGPKNITKYGTTPLVAGDLLSGSAALIFYDGVQFQLTNPLSIPTNVVGRLIGVQTFTNTGTYTPTAGTTRIIVKGQGAGGAGGGVPLCGAGQTTTGAGGGAGGISEGFFTSGFSGATVTLGAAGVAVSGAAGGVGGASSFGALMTFTGGGGGAAGAASPIASALGGAGGIGTGGFYNTSGFSGQNSWSTFASGVAFGTMGAHSLYGSGGQGAIVGAGLQAGSNALGFSSGGGGAGAIGGTGATAAGGNGTKGIIIVYEYS